MGPEQDITMPVGLSDPKSDCENYEKGSEGAVPLFAPSTVESSRPRGEIDYQLDTADGTYREDKDIDQYPSVWKLILITIALCLCVFCVALDNTIVATAIPKITDQFHSFGDVGWYGSAYLLTTCAVTLQFGRLYTFFSTKWVYLIALSIFELGSLVCAVTPNSVGLICGRAVAGLGAAGLFSGSLLIIGKTVPLRQRPVFVGLIGGMFGMASIIGPLLGGALTDHASWRWCFYINLPIGLVTAIFLFFFFEAPQSVRRTAGTKDLFNQLDLLGTVFFLPAMVCLLLALQWGGTKWPWRSARVIALLVVFGVLILVFIGLQFLQRDRATIPPRLMKDRNVWGSAWYILAVGSSFFIFTYYLPIWFQAIKNASATKSGIMSLPMILGVVICSILSGGLVTVFGYYTPFMYLSSIISCIGAGLLSTLEPDSNHSKWIAYQALTGIGIGLGLQQPMIVIQTVVAPIDVPTATAIVIFSQTLGGAVFISIAQNIFQNQLIRNIHEVAPIVDVGKILQAGATMVRDIVPKNTLPTVMQAYSDAVTQTFYSAVAMTALSLLGCIFIQWKSVKGKKLPPAGV